MHHFDIDCANLKATVKFTFKKMLRVDIFDMGISFKKMSSPAISAISQSKRSLIKLEFQNKV